jgi:hypothetical protein
MRPAIHKPNLKQETEVPGVHTPALFAQPALDKAHASAEPGLGE